MFSSKSSRIATNLRSPFYRNTTQMRYSELRMFPAAPNDSLLGILAVGAFATLSLFSFWEKEEDKFLFRRLRAKAAEKMPHYGVPGTKNERTFIAVKPDGLQRGLVGEIVHRFEAKGFKLVAIKLVQPSKEFAEKHYEDLSKRPFFPGLVKYFSSGPVVAMIWEGPDVIKGGRKLVGATDPKVAEPGSLRGDLAIQVGRNIIHGSDSPEAARHEITLWFTEGETVNWNSSLSSWILE